MTRLPPRVPAPADSKNKVLSQSSTGRSAPEVYETDAPGSMTVSPTNRPANTSQGRPTSPSPVKKKPPFVSTTKRVEVFGNPPPKPPRAESTKESNITSTFQGRFHAYYPHSAPNSRLIEPDVILPSHLLHFQRQSIRWLNLTHTLWILIVLESHRQIADRDGFTNFFQVIKWRADGTITDTEFTALYTEWMGKSNLRSSKKHNSYIGLITVRQILLENECFSESSLDLYIGMLVNEINRGILGSPLTHNHKDSSIPKSVQICNERWVLMSEELFFLLDSPGYGYLSFDEMFFLSACLTIGLHNWSNREDMEDDLSIGMVSAYALQLMIDAEAHVIMLYHGIDSNSTYSQFFKESSSALTAKSVVSLSMFKHLLFKKGVNESFLSSLIDHVNLTIERLVRVCRPVSKNPSTGLQSSSSYELLYTASHALENDNNIGSPRLWQYAVLSTIGYTNSEAIQALVNPSSISANQLALQAPPIVVYLLTDAERYIHGFLRAFEYESGDMSELLIHLQEEASTQPKLQQAMHEAAYQIWSGFQSWGPNAYSNNLASLQFSSDSSRDPSYQLIFLVLASYKASQGLFAKALIEMTSKYFFDQNSNPSLLSPDILSLVCMTILPNVENMIVRLGFGDSSGLSPERNPAQAPIPAANPHSSQVLATLPQQENDDLSVVNLFIEPATGAIKPALSSTNENALPITWSTVLDARELKDDEKIISAPSMDNEIGNSSNILKKNRPASIGNSSTMTAAPRLEKSKSIKPVQTKSEIKPNNDESASSKVYTSDTKRFDEAVSAKDKSHDELPDFMQKILDELLQTDDPDYQAKLIHALQVLKSLKDGNNFISSTKRTIAADKSLSSAATKPSRIPSPTHIKNDSRNKSSTQQISEPDNIDDLKQSNAMINGETQTEDFEAQAIPGGIPKDDSEGTYTNEIQELSKVDIGTAVTESIAANSSELSEKNLRVLRSLKPSFKSKPRTSRRQENPKPPNSINELLEQGTEAGSFAQSLREILRRMSRDDSQIHVKSLEEILRLGYEIVHRESAKEFSPGSSPTAASKSRPHSTKSSRAKSPPRRTLSPPIKFSEESKGLNSRLSTSDLNPPVSQKNAASSVYTTPQATLQPIIQSFPTISQNSRLQEGINSNTSKSRIPGQVPTTARKQVKKAFGHAI